MEKDHVMTEYPLCGQFEDAQNIHVFDLPAV